MIQDRDGSRLYLNEDERLKFLQASQRFSVEVRSFCETLNYTGCRISEALELTVGRVDIDSHTITFETLKKRKRGVYRSVPIPARLTNTLELVHRIRTTTDPSSKLWSWSRSTAWRKIKAVLELAQISAGPQTSPKGLRHGYGIAAISAGIPLNMLCKWMGHSSMETTSIYANAVGAEQRQIAEKMWQ